MPLDFPNSPGTGNTYVYNDKTYTFDGVKWTTEYVPDKLNAEEDTTTTSLYPTMVTTSSGESLVKVTSTKFEFNASTGALTANSFIKSSGTSSQFLKADGSVDSSTYLTDVAFSDIQAGSVITSAEAFSDVDNQLMTAAAIEDRILSKGYSTTTGTVTSVALSAPTGLTVSGSPVTSSGTLTLSFTSGYSIPTTTKQGQWDAAYNDKINSASFNTGTGVLTLTQQDAGTITVDLDGRYLTTETDSQTLTWTGANGNLAISGGNSVDLDGRYLQDVAFSDIQAGSVITSAEAFSDVDNQLMTAAAIEDRILSKGYSTTTGTVTSVGLSAPTGLTVSGSPITSSGTLALSFTAGYSIPTTASQTNWDAAYNDKVNSASFNTGTGVLTLTQQDSGTVTVDLDGRYLESYTETDTLDSVTDRGSNTTNTLTIGGLHVDSTGAVEMPSGTEAQRPTGVAGMFRFNSESTSFEGYDGTEWGAIGGGGGLTNLYKSTAHTASTNEYIFADTSNTSFTVTLPATPAEGDVVVIGDYASSFSTNSLTVARNSSTIEGQTEDATLVLSNQQYMFVYLNSDWKIFMSQSLAGIISERYLTGPTTGNEATTISLVIQNWQVGDVYTISVTGGTYFQDNDLVTWTLPDVTTNTLHTMTLTLTGGGTYNHDVYVVNIPVSPDTSISITDFSLNESSTGWTIS